MALEVALRRLAISAVQSDVVVQADLRAFLGFPPCGGAGRLAGVDSHVARYLIRVPVDLELSLPGRAMAPVPLLPNLRVAMWMLLSGAAHKVGWFALDATHTPLKLLVFHRFPYDAIPPDAASAPTSASRCGCCSRERLTRLILEFA